MLFMVMHKVNEAMEKGAPPDQAIIANMGKLIGDTIQAGKLHSAAGLRPSSLRVRLNCVRGDCKKTQGPLTGSNELIAGFTMLKVKSMDEAVHWASRYAELVGDVEIDVGPVVEAWDLGIIPKPSGAVPVRCLNMHKADARSEAGAPRSAELQAKLKNLTDEMVTAGVFIAAESLKPSSLATRLKTSGGQRSLTDGPFAESKELVAGFTILKADSKQEAVAWALRYAEILGDCEVDIREVFEAV